MDQLIFVLFPALAVFFNSFVGAASVRSWKKLKNSSIYVYVFSMVVANNAYGITAIVSITSYALKNNSLRNICKTHGYYNLTGFERWWTINATFQLTIFLLLGCNVLALISGMHRNPHLWGPSSIPTNPKTSRDRSLKLRQRRAFVVTIVAWVVPLMPGTLVAANEWFCFNINGKDSCSRIISPLCKQYVAVITCLWFVVVIAIAGITIFTKIHLNNMAKYDPTDFEYSTNTLDVVDSETNNSPATFGEAFKERTLKHGTRSVFGDHTMRVLRPVLLIFVSYITTFLPSVTILIIDTGNLVKNMSDFTGLACFATGLFYCLASPAILLRYLPGLRGACHYLLTRVLCSCCVTITKGELRRGSSIRSA